MTGTYRALRIVAVLAIAGQLAIALLFVTNLARTVVYVAPASTHLHWFEVVSYGMTLADFFFYLLASTTWWVLAVLAVTVACQVRRWRWLAAFVALICLGGQVLPYVLWIIHTATGVPFSSFAVFYPPWVKIGIDLLLAVSALLFTLIRSRTRALVSADAVSMIVA